MNLNNNTRMIFGVLAGAAVGYALGTLLAPKKGSDFRQSINDCLTDLSDNVSDLIAEGRDKLSELANLRSGNSADGVSSDPGRQAVS